jgi:hypothetical protein
MYTGAMPIDLSAPWLQERSRALHAELDTTQDLDAQTTIIRRHLEAALAERGIAANDYAGFNDMLKDLNHAACPWPEPDSRALAAMRLMSPLDPRPFPFPEDLTPYAHAFDPMNGPELSPEETIRLFKTALGCTPEGQQ